MGEEIICDNDTLELQHSAYNRQSRVVPEIVEASDDDDDNNDNSKVRRRSRDELRNNNTNDHDEIHVAVGKDDLEVIRWVLNHVVSPGARVNLIHIFPPVSYIPTPVGRLWTSQLSPDHAKNYANEERNKRRNLLNKYIRLCTDAKVNVDTMLIESNDTTKAILELIPVLNMTSLVVGIKHPPTSRRTIKGSHKGTTLAKKAPDDCKVTLVHHGKKLDNDHQKMITSMSSLSFLTSSDKRSKALQKKFEGNSMQCRCFPVKFY